MPKLKLPFRGQESRDGGLCGLADRLGVVSHFKLFLPDNVNRTPAAILQPFSRQRDSRVRGRAWVGHECGM